ncbi:MAG: hypothetical protein JO257_22140 [Deltaproteobacteria bacterium]|nr:hypothetical protein [Deltaproteobacteria bacterium]
MARRTIKLWQLILAGPFLLWVGWHEYSRLDELEKSGGTIYVDRLTHLLYETGGKHAVLVIWCGFGVFYIWALKKYVDMQREYRERMAALEDKPGVPIAKEPPRRREPAPRIDDDPFRAPPRPAPVIVVRPPTAPAEVPMAAGNADDSPKILR